MPETKRRPGFGRRAAKVGAALSILVTLVVLVGSHLGRSASHPSEQPAALGVDTPAPAPAPNGATLLPSATARPVAPSPGRASRSAGTSREPVEASAAARPEARSFPSARDTGIPSTVRRLRPPTTGPLIVRRAGAVIDGADVRGDISVEADNVTIKNSRVVTAGEWGIIQRPNATGLVVKDSEIRGNGRDRLQHAIFNLGGHITILRNDMSMVSDAISTSVGLIEDNYLHDPIYFPGDHTDMIQSNSGPPSGQRLVIRHNTVVNTLDQTAAIALFQDFGVQHDAVIENNLLAGGGYALYGGAGSKGTSYNIKVIDNVFSRQVFPMSGRFGPVAYWDAMGAGNVWQGNVWADTAGLVAP